MIRDQPARLAWKLHLLPESAAPEATLLLVSRGLRAFGDRLVSLLLSVYLATLDYGALEIGVLATALRVFRWHHPTIDPGTAHGSLRPG